jgi:predicted Zn-ribbon and HTH transcriptional regulator
LQSLEKIYQVDNSKTVDWEKIEKIKLQIAELLVKMADITLYKAKYTICKMCGFNSEKVHLFAENKCPNCSSSDLLIGRNRVVAFE